MRIEYILKGDVRPRIITPEQLLMSECLFYGTPQEQIVNVEKNDKEGVIRYAILFDDENNVEQMFVRNLFNV